MPPSVGLHPLEKVVQDYQPPAHARKKAKRRLILTGLFDDLLTVVYGREKALLTPQDLTMDARGRIIVSDPGVGAVHVLDGKKSFRITAGADRRLRVPSGVAVDAEDNIYVADPERGLVIVFDPEGNFLRSFGRFGHESLFHAPTDVAIDCQRGRLYLLDTPRNALFVLDLQGNILQRVGKGRGRPLGTQAWVVTPLDLDEPTQIALGRDEIVVLDLKESRLRTFDQQWNLLAQFNVRTLTGREKAGKVGLGVDMAGNFYVSNLDGYSVRIFDARGHLRSSFGQPGFAVAQFGGPSGLWIDSSNRIYVGDTNNHRVQVFQLP